MTPLRQRMIRAMDLRNLSRHMHRDIGLTQAAAGRYGVTASPADSARHCMLGLQTSETQVRRWQCGRS